MRLRRLGRLIKPVPTEFVPFYHKWKNKETKPCQGGTGAWGAAKFHFYRLARRLKARETKENEEYQLL